jgi:hypothetical protein
MLAVPDGRFRAGESMLEVRYRLVSLREDDCPPLKASRIAVREAIAYHHKLGHPVAFERGGRVIWRSLGGTT